MGRILVVDDDAVAGLVLAGQLRRAGHAVELAGDGRAGLETAVRFQPELLLTDWMMPEMDGLALVRAIRGDERLRRAYVILLTAREAQADCVAALDSGADDYLVKPWAEEELLARVRAGLRVRSLQEELAVAEKRVALLAMAATLGHEINNPLTVISASLQLLRSEGVGGGGAARHLARCEAQVVRIAGVVERLGSLREVSLAPYVGNASMLDLGE